MYVRFRANGREEEFTFSGYNHFLPDKLVFMQGKDPWHMAFNGKQSGFNVEYGPGAFRNGVPSYLPILYRNNPQSIQLISTEKKSGATFIQSAVNIDYNIQSSYNLIFETGAYEKFAEEQSKARDLELLQMRADSFIQNTDVDKSENGENKNKINT